MQLQDPAVFKNFVQIMTFEIIFQVKKLKFFLLKRSKYFWLPKNYV